MPDSLILAGQFELAPPVGDPFSQTYQLGSGYDLGDPAAVTTTVAGMMIDGDRVAGRRTGNRTQSLPIVITAPDRLSLSAATDALMQAVNALTFTLQWTPAGGLPLVWDCYRAQTKITWDVRLENQGQVCQRQVSVDFAAAPFGRSTDPQTIAATLPARSVDQMNSAPAGAYQDNTVKFQGSGSARVIPWWGYSDGTTQAPTGAVISRVLQGPTDLSAYQSMQVQVLHTHGSMSGPSIGGGPQPAPQGPGGQQGGSIRIVLSLTLTTANTQPATMGGRLVVDYADDNWWPVVFALPAGQDLTQVTGYSLTVGLHPTGGVDADPVWLDDLQALGPSQTRLSTEYGSVLSIPGVVGSARAPANLQVTLPTGGPAVVLHRPPIDQDPNLRILTAIPTATGVPIPAFEANFDGTYSAVVAVAPSSSNTGAQTATVTVNQSAGPNLLTVDGNNVNYSSALGSCTLTQAVSGFWAFSTISTANAVSATDGFGIAYPPVPSGGLSPSQDTPVPVVPGLTYTGQAQMSGGPAGVSMRPELVWYTAGGAVISTTAGTPAVCGGVQTLTVTGQAPANAAACRVQVGNTTAVPAGGSVGFGSAQLEEGPTATTPTCPIQVGSVTLSAPYTGNPAGQYVPVGEITLPLRRTAPGQPSVHTIGGSGVDVLLLDTRGETVIAALPPNGVTATKLANLFLDEPDPRWGVGDIRSDFTGAGPTGAVSILDGCRISGGPLSLEPGTNQLLAHCVGGAPSVTAQIWPRWAAERSA